MIQYVVGGLALYGAAIGGLYLMQDDLIFPKKAAVVPEFPLPKHAERMVLTTKDGFQISGSLMRALGPSRGLLIGFSGNAWNADDCAVFLEHRVKNYDIAVFHYRGYAPSGGKPSEAALFADAELIYDTLVSGMKPERVVAVGFSLGSGVASYLSSTRDLAGLVLVTPFDSIQAVAAQRHPWAPVKSLLKHRFRNDEYLRDQDIPVAIIRASDDTLVPPEHTDALAAGLRNLVFDRTIANSSHGGIYDMDEIDHILVQAIDAVDRSAAS